MIECIIVKWPNVRADDAGRRRHHRASDPHAAGVSARINGLGKKNTPNCAASTDYTLMFVRLSSWVALDQHSPLQEEALGQNVLMFPPTLVATLRTISYVWQQEEQKANIQKIMNVGASSTTDLCVPGQVCQNPHPTHPAQSSYDEALVKLKGRQGALYKAEQMRELGVNVKLHSEEFWRTYPPVLNFPKNPPNRRS